MVIRSQTFFVQRGNLSNRLVRRQAAAIVAAIAQGGQQASEIIAGNLSKAGWSWGYVSAVDSRGRTIWIADADRGDGKRFIVRAVEKLTAFLELELAIRAPLKSTATFILTLRDLLRDSVPSKEDLNPA